MPVNESSVLVRLRLLGAALFSSEARAAGASLGAMRAEATGLSGRLGGVRSKIGGLGTAIAGTARALGGTALVVGGIGVEAVHMASDFQKSMEMVHTQAGASQKEVDRLSKSVVELSRSKGQGPTELANALYRLEGAGIRGEKAMQALSAASDLASVGNANVEDTAKTLSQTWFSGIKGAGDFNQVVAELNATVGSGDLRLQQLVDALGQGILPVASEVGLTLQDVTGIIAMFGDETNNVSGWTAQLGTALHFLTNPSGKAEKALKHIGLGKDDLAADLHKPKGLLTALKDLRGRLDKLPGGFKGVEAGRVLGDIVPGGRGKVLKVALAQVDRYQKKLDQNAKTTGRWGDSVQKTHETTAFKIANAWANIQATMVTAGKALTPLAAKGLTAVSQVVSPKTFDAAKTGFSAKSSSEFAGFGGIQKGIAGGAMLVAKAFKIVKPLVMDFLNAFKPMKPFFDNVLLPLLKGFGIGLVLGVVAAVKALTLVVKILAPVLGFIGKILAPLKQVFFYLGVAIGFVATGPVLKLLGGLGKIGIVFRLLAVPVRIANALFGVVFRTLAVGFRIFGRGYVFIQRFVGTFTSAPARLIRAAMNIVGGIIHGLGSLPGRMASLAGRAVSRMLGRFAGLVRSVASGAAKIGRAIISGIVNAIKSAPGAIVDAVSSIIPGPIKSVLKKAGGLAGGVAGLFKAAGGTVSTPWQIVGERGPELTNLPMGSKVYTASQTAGMMRSGRTMAAAGGGYQDVHVHLNLSGREIHREVIRQELRTVEAS